MRQLSLLVLHTLSHTANQKNIDISRSVRIKKIMSGNHQYTPITTGICRKSSPDVSYWCTCRDLNTFLTGCTSPKNYI